jgi:hypothetical protein
MRNELHIVKRPDGWAGVRPGNDRASFKAETQEKAINEGVQIARNNRLELVIHGRNGKIRDSDSYGNDPRQIKDKVF